MVEPLDKDVVLLESADSRRYPLRFGAIEKHKDRFATANSAIEWLKHNKELLSGSHIFQIRHPDAEKALLDDVEIMRRLRL